MKKILLLIVFTFCNSGVYSQITRENDTALTKQINIIHGGNFTKNELKLPGASIFSKDENQVQFEHKGADLWCDIAIFYQKENRLEARGNIKLQQGDSIKLVSGRIDYDGNSNLAKAWQNVILENRSSQTNNVTLTTDTLRFNRNTQQAYYQNFGTVIDSLNTLTSEIGKYFLKVKKLQFQDSVHIDNPDYVLDSEQLDYYETSKNAYMYGPSTITGENYKLYCERGFYNTILESGYGIKNTRIDYNDRIIKGDSLYFDKVTEFASATNNITVIDTINKGIIRAHYAEVWKAKDSLFATKRAVAINKVEQDSLYIHGDTLMITGKTLERRLRAFRDARFYKTGLSGKCDSIYYNEKTGVTKLIANPIIWNAENQMTGDSIHLISNLETKKLDSLKVLENAFVVSLDTISKKGYNQAKGKNLYGKFLNNELKIIDLVKNTEVIYHMYNDDQELIGINKTICSAIRITMGNNEIENLTFNVNPSGDLFPEIELPKNSRKLKGFIWRGDERIFTKDDIFDTDDHNIELPVIQGIKKPIDIDAEEQERNQNPNDPVNKISIANRHTSKHNKPPNTKKNKAN